MSSIEAWAYLAARICACGIFAAAGLYKTMHFAQTVEEMRNHRIPLAHLVLPPILVMELLGTLMLAFDVYSWAVSLAWIGFIVPASVIYHGRFVTPEGGIDFLQMVLFWKNVSILGGLIALILLDPSRPAWLLRN